MVHRFEPCAVHGWGPWCKFAVDTTVPAGPEISSTTPLGAGRPITFVFHTTESDVVKFRYGWSSPLATEVAATSGVNKDASVTLTASRFGQNTLWVRAIDATGNLGNLNSHTVTVGRPSPPVASWGLETYPGINQAQAARKTKCDRREHCTTQTTPVSRSRRAREFVLTMAGHLRAVSAHGRRRGTRVPRVTAGRTPTIAVHASSTRRSAPRSCTPPSTTTP